MTAPIRYQTIKGIRYRFRDLGCEDLEKAALNRKRIAEGYGIEWWLALEARQNEDEMKELGSIIKIRKR